MTLGYRKKSKHRCEKMFFLLLQRKTRFCDGRILLSIYNTFYLFPPSLHMGQKCIEKFIDMTPIAELSAQQRWRKRKSIEKKMAKMLLILDGGEKEQIERVFYEKF